jgi:hypothetical protein
MQSVQRELLKGIKLTNLHHLLYKGPFRQRSVLIYLKKLLH